MTAGTPTSPPTSRRIDFSKDVAIFEQTFSQGSPRLERVLLAYLTDWLTTHILTSDKKLGEFLKGQRRG